MYDYDYTFVTELEVDTRQTFADVSSDLVLLNVSETLKSVNMKNTISAWQDYFWQSDNENKQKLKITFTDLSVDRSLAALDNPEYDLTPADIISYGELEEFYNYMDGEGGSGSSGHWVGGRTFGQLKRDLSCAIRSLQKNMTMNKVYPTGSIVVTDSFDRYGDSVGSWEAQAPSYISEKLPPAFSHKNTAVGFNTGTLMDGTDHATQPGANLANYVVKPYLSDKPYSHTHGVTFDPPTGSGGNTYSGYANGEWPVLKGSTRSGQSSGSAFSGSANDGSKNAFAAILATDYNSRVQRHPLEKHGTVTITGISEGTPLKNQVHIAPKVTNPSKCGTSGCRVWEKKKAN